ncbi:MAG: hypothetical protein ACRELA_03880 [Candidatus Rokuibacteriota bacterium]
MEIMLNTPRIQAAIDDGIHEGLQTMDQALALAPCIQEKITQEDALRFADSPNNLRLRMKGIR